jgi:sec-independent protein translocase protein TatA
MFGMGLAEFLIILIIVLVLFGRKLPEVGEGLGKAIRGFRKSIKEQDEIDVTPEPRREGKERDKESS